MNKKILFIPIILVVALTAYYLSSSAGSGYIKGTFYSDTSVTDRKAYISENFLSDKKLVFVDLKLKDSVSVLDFKGRKLPLGSYKDGAYLPLMIILTPSDQVIAAVRVCEPCGSFSFHIEGSKYIVCDLCGTHWDIETLNGVSGGCASYPPPRLEELNDGGSVQVDLTSIGVQIAG